MEGRKWGPSIFGLVNADLAFEMTFGNLPDLYKYARWHNVETRALSEEEPRRKGTGCCYRVDKSLGTLFNNLPEEGRAPSEFYNSKVEYGR